MSQAPSPLRNIADTARWSAIYRARESERQDALFRDPLARRLAGERGQQIAASLPFSERATWAWVTRTWLFDQFIAAQVQEGVDMVVNLAAGLDARPYRMALPTSLQWIEVDLPEILAYKEELLASEKPICALERLRLDLSSAGARRELFQELGRRAKRALLVSEGFIIYLTAEEVGLLARDLAAPPGFQRWLVEVVSPGLLRMMQKNMGPQLSQAGAFLKFGPEEGPDFFTRHGWKPADVQSMLKTAARLKRLSLGMRLLAMWPEPAGPKGSRPWSGVCLLAKKE